ncbi:MAG: PEP-CTERM sorting domain-containing protein [Chthonomonadales bacterium]
MNTSSRSGRKGALAGILGLLAVGFGYSAAKAQVVDVIGNILPSDFTSLIAPNSYKDWGNEPFIAVNPLNVNQIVISSFGYGATKTTQPGAAISYSQDGGVTWGLRAPVTSPVAGFQTPEDWNFAYDGLGRLHGVSLVGNLSGGTDIYHGMTTDPNNDNFHGRPVGDWAWTPGAINHVGAGNGDQPFMSITGSHIYVGYDNFTAGVEQRVTRSDDFGATFTVGNDLAISRGGPLGSFTNPGTRIATDGNGNAYSIFGVGTAQPDTGLQTVTYRLNSYNIGTSGASWDHTNDTANPGGIVIDSGNSHQIDAGATTWFGGINELRGNVTTIASDKAGNHIYTVYGKVDGSGVDRLYIREFHPGGGTLVGSAPVLFSIVGQRAALPSVTVTDNGTIAVEYDSYIGPRGDPLALGGTFQMHLATSTDGGLTFSDSVLYSWTAPAAPNDNNYGGNRELGDYQFVTSVGDNIYGTFAARGNVNSGGVNSTALIDPFFFTRNLSTSVPEPGTLAMIGGMGVFGGMFIVRRRRK